MKTSKSLKMNKLTKSDYHTDVMPAFVAYRKEMEKVCKVSSRANDYCRIFTERRAKGARSKYWYTRSSMPTARIENYIANNPIFTTPAGRIMKVDARWVENNPYYGFRNFALFCNAIN